MKSMLNEDKELSNASMITACLEDQLLAKYAQITEAHIEVPVKDDDAYRELSRDSEESVLTADKVSKAGGGVAPKSPVILAEILNRKSIVFSQKEGAPVYLDDLDEKPSAMDTDTDADYTAADETQYETLPVCLEKTKSEEEEQAEAEQKVAAARQNFLEYLNSAKEEHAAKLADEQAALNKLAEIMSKLEEDNLDMSKLEKMKEDMNFEN